MTRRLPLAATLAIVFALSSLGAFAQGRDHHFSDHDRAAVHTWMDHHHDHPPVGFRPQDRLPPAMEARLQVGFVLDRSYRARIHPVPHDLLVTLAPAPRHYRYVVIGDHICLIDSGYHVMDVLHLELNF